MTNKEQSRRNAYSWQPAKFFAVPEERSVDDVSCRLQVQHSAHSELYFRGLACVSINISLLRSEALSLKVALRGHSRNHTNQYEMDYTQYRTEHALLLWEFVLKAETRDCHPQF